MAVKFKVCKIEYWVDYCGKSWGYEVTVDEIIKRLNDSHASWLARHYTPYSGILIRPECLTKKTIYHVEAILDDSVAYIYPQNRESLQEAEQIKRERELATT